MTTHQSYPSSLSVITPQTPFPQPHGYFHRVEPAAVLEALPDYLFCKDTQSRYIGCNARFAELVGLKKAKAIVGLTDYDLPWQYPGNQAAFFQAGDQSTLAGQWVNDQIELLMVPDQPPLLMEVNKRPLYNHAGKVIGLVGLAREKATAVHTASTLEQCLEAAYTQAFLTQPPLKDNPLHLLVVDNSPLMRLTLQSLLVMQGEQVTLANTAVHALTELREQTFDLIITAIPMPGLSGLELAHYVNQCQSPPPMVALSEERDPALAQACFAAGIQAVYPKPIRLPQLTHLLTDCRAGRLQSAQFKKEGSHS